MPYKDPMQQRRYLRESYEKRREYMRRAKEKPCADCETEYPYYVMEFDHVRGKKLLEISTLAHKCGLDKLIAEIAKCDVVCANCHRKRTFFASLAGTVDAAGLNPAA